MLWYATKTKKLFQTLTCEEIEMALELAEKYKLDMVYY
jgi:hypothetical protein